MNDSNLIHSERLDLVPMTPAFLEACLAGNLEGASALLSAAVHPEWLQETDLMRLRLDQLRSNRDLQPWLLRAIVLRTGRQMAGHIGCHSRPGPDYLQAVAPGGVEFGYTIFTPFRRQGLASEASAALMEWAQQEHGVTRFVLSIRPDNLPSQRLAQRFGFTKVGEHLDPEDGLEHILIRQLPAD